MIENRDLTTLFLNGDFVQPHGSGRINVISPNTEQVIGSTPEASTVDVDHALAAAREALDDPAGWQKWEPAERADALDRLAQILEDQGADTARLVSEQNGMPISLARALEGGYASMVYRYYADLVRKTPQLEVRDGLMGGRALVERRPRGVVGAVIPWNFPQAQTAMKLAPALAAGCTFVMKPSPETVLDNYVLARAIVAAGLPPGVVNFVPGGRELGAYLVGHEKVDKVSFTGSTAAGRQIAETCGRMLRSVTLELGGKSAAVILDDADLDSIGEPFFAATLLNNGQTCFIGSRILAPASRYDEVVDFVAAMASTATVGSSLDESTQIGPLISRRQRSRVEDYIAQGRAEGADVVTGGGRPADLSHGWFVEPTVFANVSNQHTIAREEIFGPVLAVIPYGSIDEAVAIANDSDYGLGGSVWSEDADRAMEVARRIDSGTVGVNNYLPDPIAPYGGIASSGLGRELGPEGLAEFQHVKSIYLAAPANQ